MANTGGRGRAYKQSVIVRVLRDRPPHASFAALGLRGGGSVSNEVFQEFLKKAESPDDPHEAPCTLMEEVEVIEANWDSGGFIHVDFRFFLLNNLSFTSLPK